MKKIIVMFGFLLLLSSCGKTEEVLVDDKKDDVDPIVEIEDCISGTEVQNQLCSDFDTVNLLGHNIVYDLAFFPNVVEDINWISVIYQYKDYYNQLSAIDDAGYLSYEFDEEDLVDGEKLRLTVTYDDGVHDVNSRLMFVDVRDSRLQLKDNGEAVNVVVGGFEYIIDGVRFRIDTHTDGSYVYFREGTNEWKEVFSKYFLYRSAGHGATDEVKVVVEKMDIGLKVYIRRSVLDVEFEVDVYYVLHNELIMEPTYIIEDIEFEGIYHTLYSNDKNTYELTSVELDTSTNELFVGLRVKDENKIVILEDAIVFGSQSQDYIISHDDIIYTITISRTDNNKLYIEMVSHSSVSYYGFIVGIE